MPYLDGYAVGPVRVGVFLSELDIAAGNVHLAGLSHYELVDGISGGAGMDEVLLHLKAFRPSGVVAFSVRSLLGQDLGVGRRIAFQEPPAVGALLCGFQVVQGGVVVVVAHPYPGCGVCVLDDEHVLAGVIGVVGAGIHDHGNGVALFHADAVDGQGPGDLRIPSGSEVLLLQNGIVLHQIDCHAVGPAGIGVLVPELGVFQIDVDLAVLGHDPLDVGGFALVAGHDEVFLDLYVVAGVILLVVLVLFHVDGKERILVVAELIIPAVVALFAEVVHGGGEVGTLPVIERLDALFVLAHQAAGGADGELILAAVVGRIVQAVDDHGDILALLYLKAPHIQSLCDLTAHLGGEGLLGKEGLVQIEGDPGAVRPCGVGVLVGSLGVGGVYRHGTVLCHSPLDDGRPVMGAGVDVVALDLQIGVVEVSVFLLVVGLHVVGVEWIVAVAPLIDKAVAALGTEIVLGGSKVLSGLGPVHADRTLVLHAVHVDHGDIESAAVIGGVAFCIHHEVEPVLLFHMELGNTGPDLVLSLVRGVHVLLVEKLVVFIDLDLDAVGEVGVAVVLLELGIADAQVHISLGIRSPAEDGVVVEGGMDKAAADGKVGGSAVDVLAALRLMRGQSRILGRGAVHVGPAVLSLNAEILDVVGVVGSPVLVLCGLYGLCVHIGNGRVESTAVKCVVGPGIHHEIEALVVLHFQILDADLDQVLGLGADGYVLQL